MICQYCNGEMSDKAIFCTKCGKKVEAPAVEKTDTESEHKTCSKCGAMLKPTMRFCTKCGTQVEEETPEETIEEPVEEVKPEEAKSEEVAEEIVEEVKSVAVQKMRIAFCMGCGKKLIEGSRFCIECGKPVSDTISPKNQVKESGSKSNKNIVAILLVVIVFVLIVVVILFASKIMGNKQNDLPQTGTIVEQTTDIPTDLASGDSAVDAAVQENETTEQVVEATEQALDYNLDTASEVSLTGTIRKNETDWLLQWDAGMSFGKTSEDGQVVRLDGITSVVINITELPEKMMDTVPSDEMMTVKGIVNMEADRIVLSPSEIIDEYGDELIALYKEGKSKDYIIPHSNSVLLTEEDVQGLTVQEINYAKNEIYARHGRKFDSKELQNYFLSKSWYEPKIEAKKFDKDTNKYLSDIENKNAAFLSGIEEKMGKYQLDQ